VTAAETREFDVLLLDFGGVCLLNPVELHHRAEELLGLAPGTFDWLGPIDPSTDELWRRMIAGDGVTERDYWALRAVEVGAAAGQDMDLRAYMIMLYDPPTPEIVRAEALDVTQRALAAGYGVSVLTNDMRAFHGREWETGIELLQTVDHIVDCSDTNILKPDPRAYQRAVEMVGVPADRMLFIDDQPRNVDGAITAGMSGMWFDVSEAVGTWASIATRLGI
jgi:putative hydrolase of the HAD superfamily